MSDLKLIVSSLFVILCMVLVGCLPQETVLDESCETPSSMEQIRMLDSVFSSYEAARPLWGMPDKNAPQLWWQFYNEPIMLYMEDDLILQRDSILVY